MTNHDKVNILMVDDQPAKLLSYEAILGELGENLIKALSGREALETLLKTDVAVVLMNVSMPELDGFEMHLKTIQLRHAHIHEHHCYVSLKEGFQRFSSGQGLNQILAQFAKDGLIAEQLCRLIIHHEDVYFVVIRHCYLTSSRAVSIQQFAFSQLLPMPRLTVQPHSQR